MSNTILRNELNRALAIIKDEPHGNENLLCGEFLTDVGCAMCPISIYTGIQGYCEETKDNVAYVRLLAEVLQYSLKNLNYIVTGIKQQGCTHNNTRLCDCEKRYDVHVGAKLICNNISKDELDTYRQQQVEILPQEQPDKPPCEELLQSYARHRDAQAVAYEFKLSMFATQVLLSKCGLVMEKI